MYLSPLIALMTFNVAHFAAVHAQWLQDGPHHAGIVVSAQRPIGDTLRRLLRLANEVSANAMRDRLKFLSNW